MVDVDTLRRDSIAKPAEGEAVASAGLLVDVRPADSAALAEYRTFCGTSVHGPPQDPLWVESWIAATGADAVIVSIHSGGQPVIALALEIVTDGPFRVARFPGGCHANGNFAAVRSHAPASPASAIRGRLVAAIRSARPDIDLVCLERQNPQFGGVANPLAGLDTLRSPNISLAIDLAGGFEAMLDRSGGKRKRKKQRQQVRKFEELGGHKLIDAETPEQSDRLVSEFFCMKASRLREQGIPDVFASQEVQTFFRTLFREALHKQPKPFEICGVEVGGVIRAVHGLSVTDHSIVTEFGGIRDDDEIKTSPGFFLDYVSIEQACRDGKALYDFSVGDEDYKRSWCDIETWQFDTLIPTSEKGRLLGTYKIARANVVRFAKSNGRLWALLKGARRTLASARSALGR